MSAKRLLSLRVHATDLAEIDQLAQQHNLSRTEYMVLTARGCLDSVGLAARVNALEQRVERCEQLNFGA